MVGGGSAGASRHVPVLYQEVLATLDEYGSLVADRAESRYAEEVQRAITAMIAELEKEAGIRE